LPAPGGFADDLAEVFGRLTGLHGRRRAPAPRLAMGGQDIRQVAPALDALGGEGGDIDLAAPGVAVLDEQPLLLLFLLPRAAGAYQDPRPLELHPIDTEL